MTEGPHLLIGFGVTNRAVCRALVDRGLPVIATDDRPSPDARAHAEALGVDLYAAPDDVVLDRLMAEACCVVPTPGLPDRHPAMRLARQRGAAVVSEFDLAAEWDQRPLVAVTGTDGKTTVTTMIAAMLDQSGIATALAGNNDVPLVEAIAEPDPQMFVVEASSFRIGHSRRFAPLVATWLNFASDHLDVHADLASYEAAKARIFLYQPSDGVAITNADDPVVAAHAGSGPARSLTFGRVGGQYRVHQDALVTDLDERVLPVEQLWRSGPHDIDNALAAAATARSAGADLGAIATVLREFEGLPHRVQLVAVGGGVRYVDDSKATTPHAALAAITSVERAVLIAGGRSKGLDLGALREGDDHLVGVVAIGESAAEVVAAFAGAAMPVRIAHSMVEAVGLATEMATPGDTVLLSPGCASHDWYANYAERGADFAAAVHALGTGATRP